MNRRSLLSLIASLPIVGAFVDSADGVALRSVSHPIGPSLNDLELKESSIVTTEISLTPYAQAGEQVTCENGHVICEFTVDVSVGQTMDLKHQLGRWTQEEPLIGAQIPVCMVCGARFYNYPGGPSGTFHFKDGWRVPPTLRLPR